MKLLVVILNYKITQLTIDCLRSLEPEVRRLPDVHVTVCENGTGPEAVAELQAAIDRHCWGSWVTLKAVYPNLGFTGGNNVILRAALDSPTPPPYFMLLNADTIVRPGALAELIRFMDQHPEAGICGSRLESLEGIPRSTAFRYFSPLGEFERGLRFGPVSRLLRRWHTVGPLPTEPTPVDWVSGAALLVRREVLQQIGVLDEGLFTYFDDIDICLRARRAGWSSWLVPGSHIVHLMGQSTGVTQRDTKPKRRPSYWFEARRRFFLKNHGALYTALCDAAWIAGFSLWRLRRRVQRKPDMDPPHLLTDSIRHSVFVAGFRVPSVANPALPCN